jgi:hypothetical protein
MRKPKYNLHGEDITWVVDQIVKTFHTLSQHLKTKKRSFPNEGQLDRILDHAKRQVIEENHEDT